MHAQVWTYFPKESLPYVKRWFHKYSFDFVITPHRTSKYGDFRPIGKNGIPQISINESLNPYQFLITFTHELTHLIIWLRHKNSVKPHGPEWKNLFSEGLIYLLKKNIFPEDIKEDVYQYALNPTASSASSHVLFSALRKYNTDENKLLLKEIPINKKFKVNNKVFIVKRKLRTRYLCKEVFSGKEYYISGLAEVEIVDK
ncbi:MAG TPA: sprT domain-containing protein [Flavobacteriales bacterium]|nr:sprT domain-containing protein [Flavobacteriales bacterium]|tara:strand:- start:34654 stop:35253 length:600 start_codon:yes stop_codon:yes gene_type:complete